LQKKIAHFVRKVLPSAVLPAAHVPPSKLDTPISVNHEIPTEVKVEAMTPSTSTASPEPREILFETTPTRGERGDVDEREVAKLTARRFGTTASPYLVKYIYDDYGECLDTQYGIRKVDGVYIIRNSNVTIDDKSKLYVNDRRFKGNKGMWKLLTRKKPNLDLITAEDYEKYKSTFSE
jgi:hypothetical protein